MSEPKLALEDVRKHFASNDSFVGRLLSRGEDNPIRAVDGVSLEIEEGEALGLAGESGCGKTTLGKTVLRLHEPTQGSIQFDGRDIASVPGEELMSFRREAQMIHQNPFDSINPRFTVFKWVKEPLDVHGIGTSEQREARVLKVLEQAGLTPPEVFVDRRPSQLSGGERQRVGIARALALEPSFLLADEPVSMLDVSIRASVLKTFTRLQEELGLTALYISHDLSMLKNLCDRIAIMYLGKVVEVGPATQIIDDPQHPYTEALVDAIPRIDPNHDSGRVDLSGEVPAPSEIPSGCRFHPRCPYAEEECAKDEPALYDLDGDRSSKCLLHDAEFRERTDSELPF